ncbi:MAG: Nif3-like dinuclear metal center hexameric protein, partial [Slackia isoflavoniconvertens]|nr:Nif3-like dinuclear metal center hexameric protein [Slackia isoflavoniconvertens]
TVFAIREAAQLGANVLVTHHPAFLDAPDEFMPLSARACVPGSVVFEAARLGVALANWHTALDVSAPAQSMLPGMLRLKPSAVLEPLARDESLGYGQICAVEASEGLTLGDLSARCMAVFGRPPRVWGTMDTSLSTVCTWTGGAGDAASECVKRGIDVLVCGEVKYHAALEASQQGLCIIELGHDVSELPFARILAESCARVGVAREKITLLDQNDAWQHPETRRV